jgi:hypothetical protein
MLGLHARVQLLKWHQYDVSIMHIDDKEKEKKKEKNDQQINTKQQKYIFWKMRRIHFLHLKKNYVNTN